MPKATSFTLLQQKIMGKKTTYTEEQLISSLQANKRGAYEYLYDRYSPALYGIILKIVKNDDMASDAMQDTFLKVWRSVKTYDRDRGTLFTWLLNVARNTAIDKLRSESKSALVITLDGIAEQHAGIHVPAQSTIDLRAIVEGLLPERRQVIDMVYFQGYTHEEVSQNLGLPLGTVKSRVRKALQELRDCFSFYNGCLEAA